MRSELARQKLWYRRELRLVYLPAVISDAQDLNLQPWCRQTAAREIKRRVRHLVAEVRLLKEERDALARCSVEQLAREAAAAPPDWRMKVFAQGQQGQSPTWLSAEALEHWVEGFNHRLEYFRMPVRLRSEKHAP